ncbi:MAG: fibronectin type III domain-containing protein, partial [Bacteroidota bacterium]
YTPASPTAGQTVTVKVTDSSPWVHVGLQAVGPNTLSGDWVGVKNNGNGTWTWTWTLSGLVWGDYTLRFTSDHGTQLRGQATMQVGGSTSANNALFQMSPPNPAPGQEVTVRVTSNTPYVNTKLQVNRSGTAFWADDAGYQENDNYYNYPTHTWIYKIPGNRVREGLHNLTFAADNGATVVDQTSMPVQARSMRAITNSPFGFNGHFWWTYNCSTVGDRIQRFIDEYRALGAQTIRIGIDWKTIEKREGDPKYAFYDELLNRFNDAGIRIIGLFYTAPDWATIDGQEWNFGDQLNRSKVGAMRSMAQKIAQRYPFINHWEFWNEPQIHSEMANGEEFAFWFRNFSEAIKAVNYQDKVSFGTILETENQAEPHTTSFIKNVMTALQGYQPDAISIHPYGGYDVNKPQVELVHSLVPHIPLWVTEFGWFNYSEVDQTNALEEAINWLRSRPYVEFATMHMLHDFKDHHDTYCWFSDDTTPGEEEGKHGLVTEGFYQNASYRRKQAWYKFRELALGLVCESPSNLAASSITRSTARISWTGVSGALHYRVAYKPSADVSGWKYVTTTTTNFTLTELQPNTEYVYLLRAYCPAQGEWSAYTSNKYFTTNSGCQSPSGMGASASSTYASVSWNAVGGATSYRIAYKPTNAKSWLYKTVGGNRTTLTRLTPGAIYVYRIQTYCPGNGWTSYSGNRYFTTRGAVKIGPIFDTGPVLHRSTADEPLLGAPIEVSVYPNPVSQGAATLRIQVTEEAPLRVDLYDPAGRNLGSLWEGSLAPGQHQLELALPSMSSGLYWLEVRLGDSSRTLKLGVQ